MKTPSSHEKNNGTRTESKMGPVGFDLTILMGSLTCFLNRSGLRIQAILLVSVI